MRSTVCRITPNCPGRSPRMVRGRVQRLEPSSNVSANAVIVKSSKSADLHRELLTCVGALVWNSAYLLREAHLNRQHWMLVGRDYGQHRIAVYDVSFALIGMHAAFQCMEPRRLPALRISCAGMSSAWCLTGDAMRWRAGRFELAPGMLSSTAPRAATAACAHGC